MYFLTLNKQFAFWLLRHLQNDTNAPPVNSRDIVVSNYDFPSEVHDEDFHYSRFIAGFVQEKEKYKISLKNLI